MAQQLRAARHTKVEHKYLSYNFSERNSLSLICLHIQRRWHSQSHPHTLASGCFQPGSSLRRESGETRSFSQPLHPHPAYQGTRQVTEMCLLLLQSTEINGKKSKFLIWDKYNFLWKLERNWNFQLKKKIWTWLFPCQAAQRKTSTNICNLARCSREKCTEEP